MKKIVLIIILIAAYFQFSQPQGLLPNSASTPGSQSSAKESGGQQVALKQDNDQPLATAFEQHQNNIQVEGRGTVSRILPDDVNGSQHQKFIVQLANGQTLLLAHNITLAPRIDGLSEGDPVAFYGEYEWNSKGGVVHWTHRDPDGQHVAGWIKHHGNTYQ